LFCFFLSHPTDALRQQKRYRVAIAVLVTLFALIEATQAVWLQRLVRTARTLQARFAQSVPAAA